MAKKKKATEGLLTAEEILGADDMSHVDVPVPEWTPNYVDGDEPRKLRIQVMSAAGAIRFAEAQGDQEKARDAMVRMVVECAVDDNGVRIFTEEQIVQLREKSFAVFQRLQEAALVLNGFATNDAGEEAAKNA